VGGGMWEVGNESARRALRFEIAALHYRSVRNDTFPFVIARS